MAERVPPRLLWAVDRLAAEPDDQLLEIGCGGGIAVALIAERLREGRITTIDRSRAMVERARRRNAEHVATGKVAIHLGELGDLEFHDRSFTKVLAINVNLFWVRSPAEELEIIGRLLPADGALYLFYSPPSSARAEAVAERLVATLHEFGFPGATVETGTAGASPVVCVLARPA